MHVQLDDRYLAFTVSGEQYAVALVHVREVIAETEVIPVPFTPDYMTGIINLRGQVISVADLRKRLELKSSETGNEASILILENKGAFLGLMVDSVDFVVRLTAEQLAPPPDYGKEHMMKFVEAVARTERQFIVILSSEKLFSFEEIHVPEAGSSSTAVA